MKFLIRCLILGLECRASGMMSGIFYAFSNFHLRDNASFSPASSCSQQPSQTYPHLLFMLHNHLFSHSPAGAIIPLDNSLDKKLQTIEPSIKILSRILTKTKKKLKRKNTHSGNNNKNSRKREYSKE